MKQKFLFYKFLDDKRIYNLNQGYWKRKLQSKLNLKLSKESEVFRNVDAIGNKIYDANPIFTFLNAEKTKAVRIIQDDINHYQDFTDEDYKFLLSAWIDDFTYDGSKKVPELVISLFLTKETVEKAIFLTSKWISGNLPKEKLEEILETYHS